MLGENERHFTALTLQRTTGHSGIGLHSENVVSGREGKLHRGVVFLEADQMDPTIAAVTDGIEANLGQTGGYAAHFAPDRIGDDGGVDDLVGGGEIFFEEDGWEREHIADVVEAVAGVVGWKIVGRFKIHPDEITDGGVVFGAIQAAEHDATGIGMGRVQLKELLFNKTADEIALGVGRKNGAVVGRHFVTAHVGEHEFPFLVGLFDVCGRGVGIKG